MFSINRMLFLLSLLGFLSCTQALTPQLPDVHTLWLEPGMSTKEDIAHRYGQPADVLHDTEEESTWLYFSMTSTPAARSFIPLAGFFVAGATLEIHQLMFHFTDMHFQSSTHDSISQFQNMWAGISEAPPPFAEEQAHVAQEMAALGMPWDRASWRVAQRSLRIWRMLRE